MCSFVLKLGGGGGWGGGGGGHKKDYHVKMLQYIQLRYSLTFSALKHLTLFAKLQQSSSKNNNGGME